MFSLEGVVIVEDKRPIRTVVFTKSWIYSRGPVLSNHIGLTLMLVREIKVYWPYVVTVGNWTAALCQSMYNFFSLGWVIY